MTGATARRVEPLLIAAVAAHSFAVALAMLLFPLEGAHFGGWTGVREAFFVRQAGAFHAVVATAYLLEYRRNGTVNLLLLAKSFAVVFLCGVLLLDGGPWAVGLSALGDAAMGGAVAWLHRRARA